jgi:CDP-diacylglycerol--serine O-phosphatidyltransferase
MNDRPKHLSMLRSYTLADFFTLANASCGTITIFLCLDFLAERRAGYLWIAFLLLPLALVFDVLDGKVARANKARQSALGGDLDSLSDVISFGVAPAVLGFTLGLRGVLDMACLTYFVVCGISRLARFNVTASALADQATGKVKYFEGTPIPTSVVLVFLLAIAYKLGHTGENFWFGQILVGSGKLHYWSLLYVVSGSAMISATLRVPKP